MVFRPPAPRTGLADFSHPTLRLIVTRDKVDMLGRGRLRAWLSNTIAQ